jgi:hypothetical protein
MSAMISIQPGVYASYNGAWSNLRQNQIDAFNNGKKQLLEFMPSMGGPAPKYDKVFGNDDKGQTYAILRDNTTGDMFNCSYLIQLGDTNYHQILEIPSPPTIIYGNDSTVNNLDVRGRGIKKHSRSKKIKKRRTIRRK